METPLGRDDSSNIARALHTAAACCGTRGSLPVQLCTLPYNTLSVLSPLPLLPAQVD